jgi:hypothetical protein
MSSSKQGSLFLTWDSDLREGDLVTLTGDPLMLMTRSNHAWLKSADETLAVFLGIDTIDFGVDKEDCPIILFEGQRVIVSRGSVERAR